MKSLPPDIEILITQDGAYIEIEGFIKFLRNDSNIPPEYAAEAIHLKKIAEYLEENLQEVILQRQLLHGEYDTEKPN